MQSVTVDTPEELEVVERALAAHRAAAQARRRPRSQALRILDALVEHEPPGLTAAEVAVAVLGADPEPTTEQRQAVARVIQKQVTAGRVQSSRGDEPVVRNTFVRYHLTEAGRHHLQENPRR